MKDKIYRLLMACGFLSMIGGVAPSLYAQTAPTVFSIKDCIEYADKNNSNLKIARLDEEYGMKVIKEVKGRALPQANITGNFEDRIKIPYIIFANAGGGDTKIRMGYQYTSNLSGEVTQMLIDPSFGIGLKAAKQSTILYKQTIRQVSEQTTYNIANSYYQAIVLKEQLKLLKTNLATTQKTLSVTELQLQNGVAKQVDVKRLRVNAGNLESQIQQSQMSLEQALNTLKFSMGMPLEEQIILSDTSLYLNTNEDVLPGKTDSFFENRIEYKNIKTNMELQRLNIQNQIRGYFPTLTAYANYGYQSQGRQFGLYKTSGNHWVDYTTSSIGLRLKIPVFDGLQRHARTQQQQIKYKQLQENMTLLKQNINLEVSNAYTQYSNTLRRIASDKANVELAEEVYQITQLEFREGVSTSTDVVEAETSLRQAQNTYTRTLLELYIARLNLERAKGNIFNYLNVK